MGWNDTLQQIVAGGFVSQERRRSVRTEPVGDGTALWIESDCQIPVEVIDESESGVGVVIPPDTPFEIGPIVFIDYMGERRPAVVAHLTCQPDNSFRLGLRWYAGRFHLVERVDWIPGGLQ